MRFEPATTNSFTARGIGYAVTLAAGSATLRLRTADASTAMLEMRLVGGRADAVDCRILTVTSNEAGDNDWEITGKLTLRVRAERAGKGNGRVYTIAVTCKDEAGNVALSTVTVTVPR